MYQKLKIRLTFDDGPNEHTLKILKTLKEFNVKATFFVVGKNCQKFPEILKEIAKEGHSIGNHSFSHSIKFFFDFKKEIKKTNQIIKKITNIETKIFRPPFGLLPFWIKKYLLKRNYQIVLWDIDTKDWQGKVNLEIFRKIKPSSILLFHDCSFTSINLKRILNEIMGRVGFEPTHQKIGSRF